MHYRVCNLLGSSMLICVLHHHVMSWLGVVRYYAIRPTAYYD